MKALVKKHPEKGLWLGDVKKPEIGANELLIKIKKNSNLWYRFSHLQMG